MTVARQFAIVVLAFAAVVIAVGLIADGYNLLGGATALGAALACRFAGDER